MVDEHTSLNGGKTRPLSDHARERLAAIARRPLPRSTLNPGVADRLTREPGALTREVMLPSPFQKHRGKPVAHLEITDAGRAELAATSRTAG